MKDDVESQDQEIYQDQKNMCMISTTHSFSLASCPINWKITLG